MSACLIIFCGFLFADIEELYREERNEDPLVDEAVADEDAAQDAEAHQSQRRRVDIPEPSETTGK